MKSLFEELGGTYTLGKDGMYYPNLMIEEADQRSMGKGGRMHRKYLKEQYPSLYQRLLLNGTLGRHLADTDERATKLSLCLPPEAPCGLPQELPWLAFPR